MLFRFPFLNEKKVSVRTYPNIIRLSVLASIIFQGCQEKSSSEKLNVLLIVFDDLRPELGCLGSAVKSPNLDKFAETGIIYTNAYCNVPVCGASRASFLTGTRPTASRFLRYDSSAEVDNPEAVTLPEHFRNNGYYTIARSKIFGFPDDSFDSWDELWSPIDSAFYWRDYALEENIYLDSIGGNAKGSYPFESADVHDTAYFDGKAIKMAIEDLKKLKKADKPFFLAVGLRKPHLPFNAPKKYWDMYDRDQFKLPSNYNFNTLGLPFAAFHNSGELRAYYGVPAKGPVSDSMAISLLHGYYACISYVDHLAGQLFSELNRLGLEENTIVVILGDHGFNLGEHGLWCKHSNFDTSLRSLLMARFPGNKAGARDEHITEFIDIFPTLNEECNLPPLEQFVGTNFYQRSLKPASEVKDYALARWNQGVTLFYKNHAYTEWRNESDSIYARMLFNHLDDPKENVNIFNTPGNENITADMVLKMSELQEK